METLQTIAITGVEVVTNIVTKLVTTGRSNTMRHGDRNTELITRLHDGYSLWKCTDRFGRPWSYITDHYGYEVFHQFSGKEALMLTNFYELEGMGEEKLLAVLAALDLYKKAIKAK